MMRQYDHSEALFYCFRLEDQVPRRSKQWGAKGAFFLTEPLDNHGWELRCYMRDPNGYLIEVGQYTRKALDRFSTAAAHLSPALIRNWMSKRGNHRGS